MRYAKLVFSLWIVMMLCPAAIAYDLQQGLHGMKWGSSAAENADLTKVHETARVAYYAKPNTYYQMSSQPIPGVFYGFYDDKFFAAFIKLRSFGQFSELKHGFDTKYGEAKSSFNSESKQQVYRWKVGDVKIKLKMIKVRGQFEMVYYYAPLSTKLNEQRLENIPPGLYKLISPHEGESAKTVPLLDQ
ncbi:MAG: hypothetical protein P8185_19635 [Deltaproteobacteria bacterium]|jgi:hypothetical protein